MSLLMEMILILPGQKRALRKIFGKEIEIYFVFIGTAANVLGLSSVTQSYHAVICPDTAHIHVDECGAPEKFSGCKLLTCHTPGRETDR
jgi:threonine aldolase